jgi:hypothetical protein
MFIAWAVQALGAGAGRPGRGTGGGYDRESALGVSMYLPLTKIL